MIALVQIYALTTKAQNLDGLLVHRLAENALGTVIAAFVALLVLPISTRADIQAGLRSTLHSLTAFAADLGTYLGEPYAGIRLRSDSRSLDHALFQTRQVAAHLVHAPTDPSAADDRHRDLLSRIGARRQRLDELIDRLSAAARQVRSIARHAPGLRNRTDRTTTDAAQTLDTLTASIAALDDRIDRRPGHQQWTSCGPLIHQLINELTGDDVDLRPTPPTLASSSRLPTTRVPSGAHRRTLPSIAP